MDTISPEERSIVMSKVQLKNLRSFLKSILDWFE